MGEAGGPVLWSSLVLMLMMEVVGGASQKAKISEDSQMLCPASGGQEGWGGDCYVI